MKKFWFGGAEVELHPSLTIFIGEENTQVLKAVEDVAGSTLFYEGCPDIEQLRKDIEDKKTPIVLIKNVERDLYPTHQQKIVNTLTETFPNVQFIITTHSPYVLGSVKSEHVREVYEGTIYGVPETYGRSLDYISRRSMRIDASIIDEEINEFAKAHALGKDELCKELYHKLCEKIPNYNSHPELIMLSGMINFRRICKD